MATAHSLEQERNPWEQQAARFNLAAEKLQLDEGLWRVLRQPNREIIDHGFFAPNELPADTTRGTRERIAEVLSGRPPAELW